MAKTIKQKIRDLPVLKKIRGKIYSDTRKRQEASDEQKRFEADKRAKKAAAKRKADRKAGRVDKTSQTSVDRANELATGYPLEGRATQLPDAEGYPKNLIGARGQSRAKTKGEERKEFHQKRRIRESQAEQKKLLPSNKIKPNLKERGAVADELGFDMKLDPKKEAAKKKLDAERKARQAELAKKRAAQRAADAARARAEAAADVIRRQKKKD